MSRVADPVKRLLRKVRTIRNESRNPPTL
jgi:hypothetical protein